MTSVSGNVTFLADRLALNEGRVAYLEYDPQRACHWYIGGASGGGKTVAAMLLMVKLAMSRPDLKVWVMDFKGDDQLSYLAEIEGTRYAKYTDALTTLDDFYKVFQARLSGDKDRSPCWLWSDEMAAMLLTLPKKDAEEVKTKLSSILMMGRSMGCQLLLTMQRSDASFFTGGAKLNIGNVLLLGNPGHTETTMLDMDRSLLVPVNGVGGGHLMVNGGDPIPVQVPIVRRPDKLRRALALAVTR